MNSYELKCVIDCDLEVRGKVIGIFPADRIPKKLPTEPYGLIVNTDPHYLPGKHWIAFYVEHGKVEAFDSYGNTPSRYSSYIKQFMQRFTRVESNTKELQSLNTSVCGQYCLFYLMCRCRGYEMTDIVNIFNDNLNMNDQFVYTFIDDRFYCCMHATSTTCQICTNKN